MKTLVITTVAALALGLGTGSASAAKFFDKSADALDKFAAEEQLGKSTARDPDGIAPNEEDRGRRWMRSWRDQELGPREEGEERNWAERDDDVRGKAAGGSDGAPSERSWQDEDRDDDRGPRPPKTRS